MFKTYQVSKISAARNTTASRDTPSLSISASDVTRGAFRKPAGQRPRVSGYVTLSFETTHD